MSRRWQLRQGVRFRTVGDEAVVIRQKQPEMLVLNGTASTLLSLLQKGATVEEMVAALAAEFSVGADDLRRDIPTFLDSLRDAALAEETDGR